MKHTQNLITVISLVLIISCNTCSINSDKDTTIRGFMIDAPRGTESMDYYLRLIDFCYDNEINSIIFRLTDDQGSAYLFNSHPELKMCEGAFTTRELKDMVEYAQNKGIEMIPEVESFGHSRYITQSKRYKLISDGPAGEYFNAVCPVSDTTLSLMKDLYTEVASIFPGKYFHIGCDEVIWGDSEMSKKALLSKSKSQIWAEYINKLNGCLKAIGKTTIIWGDIPIRQEKEVLDLLDKNIILMDWDYWERDKARIDSIAHNVLNKGFKLIGCPAVSWCGWGLRVGELQFQNINAYAEVYSKLNDPDNLGIILSNWDPQRYLQGSNWDTYTIAAKILNNSGNYNYMNAIPEFVNNHFGARSDANWENIYRTIYEDAPTWTCLGNGSLSFFPWYSEKHIKNVILNNRHMKNRFSELKNRLLLYRDSVTLNKGDFNNFLLTVEFIEYNYNRHNGLLAFADSGETDLKSVEFYFKKVALEDQNQLLKITSAWQHGRRGKPYLIGVDDEDYMWSFYTASNYSKHLSENPSEFIKILKEIKK